MRMFRSMILTPQNCGMEELIEAVKRGDPDEVRRLTSNVTNVDIQRCVNAAAIVGHEPIVRLFVGLGADVCASYNHCVRHASEYGNLAVVRYLVGVGADIHVRNEECVQEASWGNHVAVVRYLVSLGADVRAQDDLAIRWAYLNESADAMQYLAEVGANILNCVNVPSLPIERRLALSRSSMLSNGANHRRAVQQLYFGWIPRCYNRGRRAGRRMTRRNLCDYLRVCMR